MSGDGLNQHAVELDLGVAWDGGAPLPHVLSNGRETFVVCRANDPDPEWDGSYTKIASPTNQQNLLIFHFSGCAAIRFGSPNDEALQGHPLGSELKGYAAYEIRDSEWLQEHIVVNSVHPDHSERSWRKLRHHFLVFHDEMFEALALELHVEPRLATIPSLLMGLATRISEP